jgi:hypothetical protein
MIKNKLLLSYLIVILLICFITLGMLYFSALYPEREVIIRFASSAACLVGLLLWTLNGGFVDYRSPKSPKRVFAKSLIYPQIPWSLIERMQPFEVKEILEKNPRVLGCVVNRIMI